nr:hypothetical protein [Tanacetum cinerariifolium]
MEAPVINISSDASEESVGSVVSRVILFGTILVEIPIVLDIPFDLPTAPELPAVSPFLCLDDSEPDLESEPANELRDRHVSLRLYNDVVSRWRDRVRFHPSLPSGSSSPDIVIPSAEILVAPILPTTARKSTLGLRPVMTPTRSAALRKACRAALSSESYSSSSSSGTSSDSLSEITSHTLESSFTASLQGTQISPKDHSHHSFEASCFPYRPLTRKRPQCLDYDASTSSLSVGLFQKRSQSSATSIPSTVHTAGALLPARANLLPPHKRYRGILAIHSYESSDEGSPETHAESNMDLDIQTDIEAETVSAAVTAAAIVNGLGIELNMVVVETGFKPELAVVESESKPEEA